MTAAPAPNPPYVPLWCKSNYSFLEGASHPEELVEACRRNGLPAMALTDRNGVYGIVRAHVQARQAGIHLIPGSQIGLRDGSEILLLAQNRKGYGNLCSLLTDGHLRSSKGTCAPGLDEVCGRNPGLIALWIGRAGPEAPGEGGPEPVLEQLKTAFGDRPVHPVGQTPPGGGDSAGKSGSGNWRTGSAFPPWPPWKSSITHPNGDACRTS